MSANSQRGRLRRPRLAAAVIVGVIVFALGDAPSAEAECREGARETIVLRKLGPTSRVADGSPASSAIDQQTPEDAALVSTGDFDAVLLDHSGDSAFEVALEVETCRQ